MRGLKLALSSKAATLSELELSCKQTWTVCLAQTSHSPRLSTCAMMEDHLMWNTQIYLTWEAERDMGSRSERFENKCGCCLTTLCVIMTRSHSSCKRRQTNLRIGNIHVIIFPLLCSRSACSATYSIRSRCCCEVRLHFSEERYRGFHYIKQWVDKRLKSIAWILICLRGNNKSDSIMNLREFWQRNEYRNFSNNNNGTRIRLIWWRRREGALLHVEGLKFWTRNSIVSELFD